ncbi:MAG: hypothetical protein ABI612_18825, partial [Betaproteobacteria bacterium]
LLVLKEKLPQSQLPWRCAWLCWAIVFFPAGKMGRIYFIVRKQGIREIEDHLINLSPLQRRQRLA